MNLKLVLASILIVFIGVTSCKKDDVGIVSFKINEQVNFTIPPNTLLDIFSVVTPGVTTNWESEFSNNDTRKDRLEEMKLGNLVLTITNPAGKTFKFLKDIDIYINADGLAETKIAFKHDISENVGQTLDMDEVDVDISPYAKKDNFTLRMETKPRSLNSDNVQVRADITFDVKADVLD